MAGNKEYLSFWEDKYTAYRLLHQEDADLTDEEIDKKLAGYAQQKPEPPLISRDKKTE